MEASSSASGFEGDHVEEREERGGVDSPMCETSSSLRITWFTSECRGGISSCCNIEARVRSPGMRMGSLATRTCSRARPDPLNFFCSHPRMGLLLWRFTRFCVVIVGRQVGL